MLRLSGTAILGGSFPNLSDPSIQSLVPGRPTRYHNPSPNRGHHMTLLSITSQLSKQSPGVIILFEHPTAMNHWQWAYESQSVPLLWSVMETFTALSSRAEGLWCCLSCTSHLSALVSSWYRRPSLAPVACPSRTRCFFSTWGTAVGDGRRVKCRPMARSESLLGVS